MKRIIYLAMSFWVLSAVPSWASGVGLVFTYNSLQELDIDSYYLTARNATEKDFSLTNYSLGFIRDSNLSKNELFNYRFELHLVDIRNYNLEYKDLAHDQRESVELKMSGLGFSLKNDFGFGFKCHESWRAWAGFELTLGYSWASSSFKWINWSPMGDDRTESSTGSLIGVGIGAVLGINYNFAKDGCIPIKISYTANYWECNCAPSFVGNIEMKEYSLGFSIGLVVRKNES